MTEAEIRKVLMLIDEKLNDEALTKAMEYFIRGADGMALSFDEGNQYAIEIVAALHYELERWLLRNDAAAPLYLRKNRASNLDEAYRNLSKSGKM